MNLIERVKQILVSPQTEWDVIEREATPPAQVLTAYVLPLAAAGAVATAVGMTIAGLPLVASLLYAIVGIVVTMAGCVVAALIIDAFATTFGGRSDRRQAFKLAAYAFTPSLVAQLLRIVPWLGILGLIVSLYAIYLLYLGIPKLMKAPADRTVAYTLVVVLCTVVAMWILAVILGLFFVGGALVASPL